MGYDHGKVTINLLSNATLKKRSLSCFVIGGTDNFVKRYELIKSGSRTANQMGKTKLTVTIEGDYENQTKSYVSNNTDLIKAVIDQNCRILKTSYL